MAQSTPTEDTAKDRQFIASLAKGLQVLACFNTHGPELGTTEIAALTGMPQPTVWRICHTLLELGYLVQAADRSALRLGLKALGLGYSALAAMPVDTLAMTEMQALARRYEGAVSLGAPDGLDMVYIQRCQGSSIVHADLRVGSRVPMAISGTGWAYIAALAPDGRESLFARIRAAQPEVWARVEVPLKTALAAYPETGFVINIGQMHPRINSVAVPVVSPDGTRILTLSCGGIGEVFTPAILPRIGADLIALARNLSPALAALPLPIGPG